MTVYPLIHKPDFSYHDFLMHNQYIGDLKNGMRSASSDVVRGQALSTKILNDTLNKNKDFIASTIDSNFYGLRGDISTMSDNVSTSVDRVGENISELKNITESGFDTLGSSVDNVASSISTLNDNLVGSLSQVSSDIQSFHSDFNMAMGGVVLQFEMQRAEMKQGFDSIISILENKRKTDAAEDFRDAIEFYNDGCKVGDKPVWFKNAHKHFSASIDKYERNPLAHLHLAHIYHYQEEFRDFDKALEHYELCYTYGEADEKSKAVTAQGYFYAGWLKASVFDDFDSAIKLTEEALMFDKFFSEAYYNLAKFYSLQNDSVNMLKNLEIAIVKFDRNYMIKAESDTDFDNTRNFVHKLVYKLLTSLKEDIENKVSVLKINYPDTIKEETARRKYNSIWENVYSTEQQVDTYFSALDAILLVSNFANQLEVLSHKQEKFEAYFSIVNQIKSFVSDRICSNEEYHQNILAILNKVEQSMTEKKHHETLLTLLSILDKPLEIDFNEAKIVVREAVKISFINSKTIAALYVSDFKPDVEFINLDNLQIILRRDRKDRSIETFPNNMTVDKNKGLLALAFFEGVKIEILDIKNNLKCISTLRGHGDCIEYLEFSPDGKYLLSSSGHDDKNVRLWDIEKGSCLLTIPSEGLYPSPIAFSPCGTYFIVANPDIYLYELNGYKKEFLYERFRSSTNIIYSSDGRYIAYATLSEISILDISTKNQNILTIDSDEYLKSISYSPDGRYIAVGDTNGATSIFDIENKKIVLSLGGIDSANVQYSPDGRYIATKYGISSGKVYLWDMDEIVDKNFDTDLILDQLKSYYTMTKNEYNAEKERENLEYNAEKERENLEKKNREEERKLKLKKYLRKQQDYWRQNGRCEICGGKLGTLDRMFGGFKCKGCKEYNISFRYKDKRGVFCVLTSQGILREGERVVSFDYETSIKLIKKGEFIPYS